MYIAIQSFRNKKGKLITRGTMVPWWRYLFINQEDRLYYTEEDNYLHAIEDQYRQTVRTAEDQEEEIPVMSAFMPTYEPINSPFPNADWDPHPHEDFREDVPTPLVGDDDPLGIGTIDDYIPDSCDDPSGVEQSQDDGPTYEQQVPDSTQQTDNNDYSDPVSDTSISDSSSSSDTPSGD